MISKNKKPAYGFTSMFESKRKKRKGKKSEPIDRSGILPGDWMIDEQTEIIKRDPGATGKR